MKTKNWKHITICFWTNNSKTVEEAKHVLFKGKVAWEHCDEVLIFERDKEPGWLHKKWWQFWK